jgi:hypothetical protein
MKPSRLNPLLAAILTGAVLGTAGTLPRFASAEDEFDGTTGATYTTTTPDDPQPSSTPSTAQTKATLKATAIGRKTKGSFTYTRTAKKSVFSGTLQLPLPNTGLGLTNAAAAEAADLVLEIARSGQVYVRCDLDSVSASRKKAKYAVNVIKRKGTVQQKTGLCELAVYPGGPGLPTPEARDTLAVKLKGANGDRTLATGTFTGR